MASPAAERPIAPAAERHFAHAAERHFALDHRAAEGHFPGNPILPGAVLLGEIIAAISGQRAMRCEIRAAKFHRPVRPGDRLRIVWSDAVDADIRFSCSVTGGEPPAVTGSVRFPAPSGGP